jgi:hypothetical protein
MHKLEKWYREMGKQQKIFVYIISIGLILAFGFGLLPLAILIYLELGERNRRLR